MFVSVCEMRRSGQSFVVDCGLSGLGLLFGGRSPYKHNHATSKCTDSQGSIPTKTTRHGSWVGPWRRKLTLPAAIVGQPKDRPIRVVRDVLGHTPSSSADVGLGGVSMDCTHVRCFGSPLEWALSCTTLAFDTFGGVSTPLDFIHAMCDCLVDVAGAMASWELAPCAPLSRGGDPLIPRPTNNGEDTT